MVGPAYTLRGATRVSLNHQGRTEAIYPLGSLTLLTRYSILSEEDSQGTVLPRAKGNAEGERLGSVLSRSPGNPVAVAAGSGANLLSSAAENNFPDPPPDQPQWIVGLREGSDI
jgi:hypothetical protein